MDSAHAQHPLKGKIICVDGPSASGKGTLAKKLARAYRMKFLDTGCLYRAVAWQLARDGVADDSGSSDLDAAVRVAEQLAQPGVFDFKHVGNNVFAVLLNGEDITEGIRTLENGLRASRIAQHMPLRLGLRSFQQEFARHWRGVYGVVLDGRDTGSKIAPDGDLKLMMAGDPAIRAQWRLKDYLAAGKQASLAVVQAELEARDAKDRANMEMFPETVTIDVTASDAAGIYAQVVALINERFGVRALV